MRAVYKVLAYIVAAEVAIHAMAIVYGVAGEGKWVAEGGVVDKAQRAAPLQRRATTGTVDRPAGLTQAQAASSGSARTAPGGPLGCRDDRR